MEAQVKYQYSGSILCVQYSNTEDDLVLSWNTVMLIDFKGVVSITEQLCSIIQNTFHLPDRVISDVTNRGGWLHNMGHSDLVLFTLQA